jgi:recombination protein RecT
LPVKELNHIFVYKLLNPNIKNMVTKADAAKSDKEKTPEKQGIAKVAPATTSPSERFSKLVIRDFQANFGGAELTRYQNRLIQNYFISIDMALKKAEEKRMLKKEQYRDAVAVIWPNVNMESLALNVVACAMIGYDPAQPNHINMVPYKNNKSGKYDIGFIDGYRGKELKAKKYGYDMPDHVIVELVFAKDKFVPIKRDKDNPIETYVFKVSDTPMDRGEIIGGFYYHEFKDNPEKNKLMFYNRAEIEKRKPEYASVEFWGGIKDKWEDGKKVGKETVEGWFPEMCWKTLYRLAYGAITIDSEKIDENLMRMLTNEREFEDNKDPLGLEASSENSKRAIDQGANKEEITMTDAVVIKDNKEVIPAKTSQPEASDNTKVMSEQPDNLSELGKTNKAGF